MDKESPFDPKLLSLKSFRFNKWDLITPEGFIRDHIQGYDVNVDYKTGFNVDKKAAKSDLAIQVSSRSEPEQEEASCLYDFSFFYSIENFNSLVEDVEQKEGLSVNIHLIRSLSGISYSTARGILMTRLQGTVLQSFVMPIIDPGELIEREEDNSGIG